MAEREEPIDSIDIDDINYAIEEYNNWPERYKRPDKRHLWFVETSAGDLFQRKLWSAAFWLSNTSHAVPNARSPQLNKWFIEKDFVTFGCKKGDDPRYAVRNREYRLARVLARPGQTVLRQKLIKIANAVCEVTGCDVLEALEACHIVPVYEDGNDVTSNAILLRADLHRLFDAQLLSICPKLGTLEIDKGIGGSYSDLQGKKLNPDTFSRIEKSLRHRSPV